MRTLLRHSDDMEELGKTEDVINTLVKKNNQKKTEELLKNV